MLLNRITERYQLDLVMVFEDNTENDGMVMTNYLEIISLLWEKCVSKEKSFTKGTTARGVYDS